MGFTSRLSMFVPRFARQERPVSSVLVVNGRYGGAQVGYYGTLQLWSQHHHYRLDSIVRQV